MVVMWSRAGQEVDGYFDHGPCARGLWAVVQKELPVADVKPS